MNNFKINKKLEQRYMRVIFGFLSPATLINLRGKNFLWQLIMVLWKIMETFLTYLITFLWHSLDILLYAIALFLAIIYIGLWKFLAYKGNQVAWFLHLPLNLRILILWYTLDVSKQFFV